MVIIVGKLDGYDIIPLEENEYEEISGEPITGDVFMRRGKVYAKNTQHTFDVTSRFADLVGWKEYEPPLQRSDVL